MKFWVKEIESMNKYVYQPEKRHISFLDGVQILSKKGYAVTTEAPPHRGIEELRQRMATLGAEIKSLTIDINDYRGYFKQAEYLSRHPTYYPNNLTEKSIEHYICYRLLTPRREDVLIDIASENSPLAEIWTRLYGLKAFSQDIMYKEGVHQDRIGSDACSMPVKEGFASKAVLTCSLEHFEGDSDTRLFQELFRVLKPGGMVCIVPFYFYTTPFILTDPTISAINDVTFDQDVLLYCREGWGNRHGRHYSPETIYTRIVHELAGKFRFDFFHIANARDIHPASYASFAFTATRLG